MQAPRQAKGAPIKASLLNEHADAIDSAQAPFEAPRDLTEGTVTNEQGGAGSTTWTLSSRVSETVRVENPDDATQYVDVDRDTRVVFVGTGGRTMTLNISY